MRKLVNGKVVDIINMDLFELAAEGLAIQSIAVSATSEGIEGNINSPIVKRYIKQYDIFFRSMPYPLYAIEANIKYATLGNFIKTLSQNSINMWIENGLNILIDKDTGMLLKIVNNTWSIAYTKDIKEDNTSMDLYKESIGYKEYSWLLSKIINKEATANFYTEFMPEFVRACNNQPMVLKWELENMLTFGQVPNKIELKQDKIIDIANNKEFSLDIYCTGTTETNEKVQSWSLSGNTIGGMKYKSIRTYGYDAYSKNMSKSGSTSSKIEKCKVNGFQTLFLELCNIKNALEMTSFPTFYGIMQDTNLVFTIDRRLYVAKSNRIAEAKDIAHNVELYALDKNKVYFVKSKKITDKISKDTLYSYNIPDGTVRICKIMVNY